MGLRKFKNHRYLKMFGGWDDGPSHCIYYKNWWKYFKQKHFPRKDKSYERQTEED